MKSIIRVFCGSFIMFTIAQAAQDNHTKQNPTQSDFAQPKLEIKGDSFVIVDSSCESQLKKSVFTNLQNKDSQISTPEECQKEVHTRTN